MPWWQGAGQTPYAWRRIQDTFYSYGEIVSIRSQPDRGQAFVEYTQPEAAELAIAAMNRKEIYMHEKIHWQVMNKKKLLKYKIVVF